LISIRKSANELERLDEFGRSAIICYSQAIGSTDRHAIEFNADQVTNFRTKLQVLQQQLQGAGSPEQLRSVQASFDSEVSSFQGRVRDHFDQLRREMATSAAALMTFTGSYNQSGSDLEAGVTRELKHLNNVATSDNIDEIRGAIRTATARITADVSRMRSSNQLAIAQFKDEVRLLHQEIQTMQRSLRSHSEEQNPVQQHLNSRMDELARQGRHFSVLLAVIRNFDRLQNSQAPKVLENGLNTFNARFQNGLPGSATVGRWDKDQFAAVLDIEPAVAIAMSRDVMRSLSAPIVEQTDGALHTLVFDTILGSVHFRPGGDLLEFQTKITELIATLSGRGQ
jgi:GGDEF domain-containing protein